MKLPILIMAAIPVRESAATADDYRVTLAFA